jgi:hypothetical protein
MRSKLLWMPLLLLACQQESVTEPAGGAKGEPSGPPPEGQAPVPDPHGPDRDAPITVRLEGTLVYEEFSGGVLQVDVVGERDGNPNVVGMERYEQPGPFRIAVRGEFETVDLVVYVDADGDGPSAGDLRVEYSGNPISVVDVELIEGLVVDLSMAEAQDGAPNNAEEPGSGQPNPDGDEAPPAEGSPPADGQTDPDPTEPKPPEDGASEESGSPAGSDEEEGGTAPE